MVILCNFQRCWLQNILKSAIAEISERGTCKTFEVALANIENGEQIEQKQQMELNSLHKRIAGLEKELESTVSEQKLTIENLNEQVCRSKVFL